MKKVNTITALFLLITAVMMLNIACNQSAKLTKDEATKKLAVLQSKYDIANTQWYDIYEKGLVPGAPEAIKILPEIKKAIEAGDLKKAEELIAKAEPLLDTYTKANLPDYNPVAPLANPNDMGNIRKAAIGDLQAMEFLGIPRWNYWFNFVGKSDDGTLYMAYAYINHHGTGKFVAPAVFAYSTNKDAGKTTKVNFTSEPKLTDDKDSRTWLLKEGDNTLTYILKDGKISVKFESPDKVIDLALTTKFSFWYNKGVVPPEFLPGATMSGFEEPGYAEGTFTTKGQKVNVKGFGESENLACGGTDYRSALLKYGNEWWVTFNTDQAAGLIIFGGKYKDAGLFLDGKYIIPSSIQVVPIEANVSFTMIFQTSVGELKVNFACWGWDPALYEHWATCDGSYKGKPLTNGFAWLEHIPQGGVNSSPPDGTRKAPVKK
jgi:hypothetical protein